jgi:hypothetical protein
MDLERQAAILINGGWIGAAASQGPLVYLPAVAGAGALDQMPVVGCAGPRECILDVGLWARLIRWM